MVLTSFNTAEASNDILVNNTTVGIDGNQSAGQSRKVDMMGTDLSNQKVSIDGNQSAGQSRKVD